MMKREIKFRGLSSPGLWVYGILVITKTPNGDKIAIKDTDYNVNNGKINLIPTPILQGTEGQYIGIKDQTGKEIFEGDWVDIIDPNTEKMDDSQCVFYDSDYGGYFIEDDHDNIAIGYAIEQGYEITVVGNTHED